MHDNPRPSKTATKEFKLTTRVRARTGCVCFFILSRATLSLGESAGQAARGGAVDALDALQEGVSPGRLAD